MNSRFDRNIRFFGLEGQQKIRSTSAALIGLGGLGCHVAQQLALLGLGRLRCVDTEELADTDRNRHVAARYNDPVPGSLKTRLIERMVGDIDPEIEILSACDSLVSELAFRYVIESDYVFGCLDSEGARLLLTELCIAYDRPYFDLSSDIIFQNGKTYYGGQICLAREGRGCLVCLGLLDIEEAQRDLGGEGLKAEVDAIYGVGKGDLRGSGPSVVSINGVVASVAVTEFLVSVAGIRQPNRLSRYDGNSGKVTVSTDQPKQDCYYCHGIRGLGVKADVERYIREGVGTFLR